MAVNPSYSQLNSYTLANSIFSILVSEKRHHPSSILLANTMVESLKQSKEDFENLRKTYRSISSRNASLDFAKRHDSEFTPELQQVYNSINSNIFTPLLSSILEVGNASETQSLACRCWLFVYQHTQTKTTLERAAFAQLVENLLSYQGQILPKVIPLILDKENYGDMETIANKIQESSINLHNS